MLDDPNPTMAFDALPANLARDRPVAVARLVQWTPWPYENPSLIGHCSIAFSGGWVVHAIPVFRRKDGSVSVGPPTAAELDREGKVKLDGAGKRQYRPIVSFEGAAGRERWDRSILGALAAAGIGPAGEGGQG